MKKTIIVDCDGVLCNWEYAFHIFMEEYGFQKIPGAETIYNVGEQYGISKEQGKKMIRFFNESAAIGYLPPLRDAVEAILVITSTASRSGGKCSYWLPSSTA